MSKQVKVPVKMAPARQPPGYLHNVQVENTMVASLSSSHHSLLQLQRLYGNRYVQRFLSLRPKTKGDTIAVQSTKAQSKTDLRLAPAGNDSVYIKPETQILEIIRQMDTELAVLRTNIIPAHSTQEEAQRTFCVVKVIGIDGKVKLTTTGSYLRKGLHAEAQAINKLNLNQIADTDTVLLMVDQFPCEEKCTPEIQQFRNKVRGEFRVFTKVKVNPKTRIGGSPKSAALAVNKSSQELMELTEFQKLKSSPGDKSTFNTTPLSETEKGNSSPKMPGKSSGNATIKTTSSAVKAQNAFSTKTTSPSNVLSTPKPTVTSLRSTNRMGGSSRLQKLMKGFGRGIKLFFSPAIQVPLSILAEIQNAVQAMTMATSGLAGQGFILTAEIEKSRQIEKKIDLLLNHYEAGYHEDLAEALTEANILIFSGSHEARMEMAIQSKLLIPDLSSRLLEAQRIAERILAIKNEADRKYQLASKLLQSKEFAVLSSLTGSTAQLAQLFGASEDLLVIRGIMSSSQKNIEKLNNLIEEDRQMLKVYK